MTKPLKVNLVSLGCARNRVDSEIMLGRVLEADWEICSEPDDADVIIVNTCSFIETAVDESIDTILALAEFKKTGRCRRLVVAGCLPERFREELAESLPEVDIFLGTGAYDRIIPAIRENLDAPRQICELPDPNRAPMPESGTPRVPTTGPAAYLKIAEGCGKHCTYCMIPMLRGGHRSRPAEQILAEARTLMKAGIREIILVAQDTTAYGHDLAPALRLDQLLAKLAVLNPDARIRFLYGHPESFDLRVAEVIKAHTNICAYFDIPIQHASNTVLKRMGRRYRQSDLVRLFENIREMLPDAALRTTTIVGFPGETASDFDTLVDFAKLIRFDHLGVFTYSDAPELPSHRLPDHVDKHTADERFEALMACQADISQARNLRHKGNTYSVLVEGVTEEGQVFGRTCFQAPEVDGVTYITDASPDIGRFVNLRVMDTDAYDLTGVLHE